ncbi:DUF5412 domain-containing protein [Paenibacillus sp. RC67]|uniref:DUF5412 domain-containing protein n=1 Tax=Paenibacillus sp. RC67 TaxID=3039392 RepID=UPI0024AE63C0|nr:DUF5412 domain-containing protein [Paenibacillus sp. RC67]
MKKTKRNVIRFVGIIALIFIGLVSYGIYWVFFDKERLLKGEFLTEVISPDGTYTVKAYLANGGATTSFAIRGELIFNERNMKPKNIYWNYRENKATIVWSDNNTVIINGHTLNVPNDKYDFRRILP